MTLTAVEFYELPAPMRMPLKFGAQSLTHVRCARAKVTVRNRQGQVAQGWGETPLAVGWSWPSSADFAEREQQMVAFCQLITCSLVEFQESGHPLEIGWGFVREMLPKLLRETNDRRQDRVPMPYLAALVCFSVFDQALHDAYGNLHQIDVYQTYNRDWMTADLATYLRPSNLAGGQVHFKGKYVGDYLLKQPPTRLPAWHLVGGLDPLDQHDVGAGAPDDGYPVTLRQWITTDGLTCLKIKLRGNDAAWDYDRIIKVAQLSLPLGVRWLSVDFNCTVTEPAYVNDILDRLRDEHPRVYGAILYVEQPFPYELEEHRLDVRSVAARKPLFMDESAHDWEHVALGYELGWNAVALKTCKTQSGALLSLCWAKAHGMPLMVQDLTNPMLAIVPHVRLAAHAGTIMGVEVNGCQFYPQASAAEAAVHPGLYQRRQGELDLSTLAGAGFGYGAAATVRPLPPASAHHALE